MIAIFDPRLAQVPRMIYQKLKALRVPENGRNIRNCILESCAGCVHENTRTDQGGKISTLWCLIPPSVALLVRFS